MTETILIVEDDLTSAAMFRVLLTKNGYDVHVANTGTAALEMASRFDFDAVISDIAMPRMDGVELLARLHQRYPGLPVLFLTGQPEVETAQRAIELQAFRYLVKPVELKTLLAAVKRATSHGRFRRAQRDAAAALPAVAWTASGSRQPLDARFEDGMRLLRACYVPVVASSDRKLRGFKVLPHCLHPSFPKFEGLCRAADQLGRRQELRRRLWSVSTSPLEAVPESVLLFIWTDLAGLGDDELLREESAMSRLAKQVVLVVADRVGIDHQCQTDELREVRSRGYRIGLDRLGDGYAGLNSLAWLGPDFLELDPYLVRNVADNPEGQRVLRALLSLARELNAEVVAEGVNDERDQTILSDLGCELLSWSDVAAPDELAPLSAGAISALRHAPW